MRKFFVVILLFLSALVAGGCGSGGGGGDFPVDVPDDGGGDTGGDTGGLTSGVLILSASKSVIKPDNTDSSEITVYVLSDKNIVLPGVNVSFSTDTGALKAGTATTDASGKASVTFTSGAMANNSTATIRASAGTTLWKEVTVQAADANIPATLIITASPATVKTNDTDTSTITVTVLNASGGIMPDQEVKLQASGGSLNGTTLITGADGKATTTFQSGLSKSNSTVTINATVGTLPADAPASIQLTGSTLSFSPATSPASLSQGQKETLTVTARDAAGVAIPAQTITFESAGVGSVNLSATTAITDPNGQVTVEVTGASEGTANLTIRGVGATVTKAYSISGASGFEFFHITSPASEVATGSLNNPFTVTVSAPAPTTTVRFATTLGTYADPAGVLSASNIMDVPVNAGIASAQLTATRAGIANISVTDKAAPSITDSATISFSATADTATQIVLQADRTVLATTVSTDSQQQANLTATVRNADNQVVGGAPVSFRIANPTGGGEFISPPVAYTNAQGQAKTTFTSGTLPSSEGVEVIAALVEIPAAAPSSLDIKIGGEAGSITLGRATKITDLSTTAYSLPMSALISDGTGGPPDNTLVSLTIWPEEYLATDGMHYPNEDTNENLTLDAGEDTNCDGELTPPVATAGNIIPVPGPQIITDDNGIANFNLIYLKANYDTSVRVTATAEVSGTETTSSMYFDLPVLDSDLPYLPAPTFAPKTSGCPVTTP